MITLPLEMQTRGVAYLCLRNVSVLEHSQTVVNGDASNGETPQRKWDVIIITGKRENCEGAKAALQVTRLTCLSLLHSSTKNIFLLQLFERVSARFNGELPRPQNLVPITKEVRVPTEYHRFIIGGKGRSVQNMMKEFDVNISIPKSEEGSDIIKVSGAPANVANAEKGLEEKVRQLDEEKEERVSKHTWKAVVTRSHSSKMNVVSRQPFWVLTERKTDPMRGFVF